MHTWDDSKILLAEIGMLKPQKATDWKGLFPLPQEIADFYAQVGPVDLTIQVTGNPIVCPALKRLANVQIGYRTHGNTGERIPNWPDRWLTIFHQGADPYIYDSDSGEVLFAIAGGGIWRPKKIASDLPTAVGIIATAAKAFAGLGDAALDDETCEMTPLARKIIKTNLASYLNDANEAKTVFDLLFDQ